MLCSLQAINLAARLSSFCRADFWLGLWLEFQSCWPDLRLEWLEPLSEWPECGWTQIFEVCGLGLFQMHLFHYRLEFWHGFRSLLLPGRLGQGLVGVSTSDMGKVPGGFGTTRVATLWFSFTSWVGIAPSLLLIRGIICLRWFQMGGCSTMAGLTHRAAFLEDFWWWWVDSGKRVGKRVLGTFLRQLFLRLWRWCRGWARGG